MTVEEIETLAAWCASAGIGEIEVSEAEFSLRLCVQSVLAQPPVIAAEAPLAEAVFKGARAPGVGVFRLNHPTTGHPVAEPGKTVSKGEMVGVLQVGPCLKAVLAPADGVLGAALAEDGAVVGYGTPLYELA
ncbi:biotin attachment protein [Mesorhizobium sp. B283B1A]|uniref:biotin attachment protein n=1 Tax=Mesorhizobium TaxID=68287 RepID=UPI001CD0768C|nr:MULTISPECIES: biotin attachment protein [Mesorhizobium]MCA0050232.1 biotin attachment protein [Mesorhizobium sp. B283B1A]UQS66567.1 biotin attachment protein [Mesorhizobium opportunistum]